MSPRFFTGCETNVTTRSRTLSSDDNNEKCSSRKSPYPSGVQACQREGGGGGASQMKNPHQGYGYFLKQHNFCSGVYNRRMLSLKHKFAYCKLFIFISQCR